MERLKMYTQTPTGVKINGLKIMDKVILFYLISLGDEVITITDQSLYDDMGIEDSIDTLRRSITKLIKLGYINKTTVSNKGNGYGGKTRYITINYNNIDGNIVNTK
jgi:predicted transcriptional regulator